VFHEILYNGVPPPTVTVAEPLDKPQVAGKDVYVDVKTDGSIIVKLVFIEQLFPSVTVNE
jgi:hypothetical protein